MEKSQGTVRFGAFEFDLSSLELSQDGARVHLQPQPAEILALLLGTPGRLVTRDELKQKVWKDRIIEFDGGLNYSIRQVRKVLGDNAESPVYVETVHGRGYRFIGECDRSPSAEAPELATSNRPRFEHRLGWAAAILAVLVGAFAWQASGSREGPAPERIMLAVLPFEELFEADSLRFFSRGLTEDLMTELATLGPDLLGVIGPASVGRIVAEDPDFMQIRARLGADFVVRGAVRQVDGQRRVTVRVESTEDGSPIWARRYDRAIGQDMAVQADIARDIAEALSLEMLGTARTTRRDDLSPAVQESLLVARWLLDRSGGDDVRRGLHRLDAIRASVPDYAPAWALTARGHVRLGRWDAADRAARHALELDPKLAQGHFQLAQASMYAFRLDDALSAYRRAVELAPGIVSYRQWFAHFLSNVLRFDESIQHMELARALDPISTSIEFDLSAIYLAAGRYDNALVHCAGTLELTPQSIWARKCMLAAHYFDGEVGKAVQVAREIMRLGDATPDALASVSMPDAGASIKAYFGWVLEQLEAQQARGEQLFNYEFAHAYGQLHDREATLAQLRGYVEARAYPAQWMARDVWFRFLHGDAEFESMLRELGLPSPSAR